MKFRLRTPTSYQAANITGILYTVVVVVGIIAVVLLYVCPATYGEGSCNRENLLGCIIFAELTMNFILFQVYSRHNDPQRWAKKARIDGATIGGGSVGKYCIECNRMAPKRSHHCILCKMCVLRKDHHCFMTGACVGIANQRYFIVFVLWAGIGAGIGSYYLLMYLLKFVESKLLPYGFLKLIAPFAVGRWLAGLETFSNMIMCILFCISFASSAAALIFFFSQMFYTLNGCTMYDYHTLCRLYELKGDGESYTERLHLVFGKYWPLNFIFPQVWFPNRLTPDIAVNIFNSCSKDL